MTEPRTAIDWRSDERTYNAHELDTLPVDTRRIMGCYYDGADGFVYRMLGWRRNDGPWIGEVLGRGSTPVRTISLGAVGRTFRHHRFCPCHERSFRWEVGERGEPVTWAASQQSSDGYTLWVADDSTGSCLGRFSAAGYEIFSRSSEPVLSVPGSKPTEKFGSFAELLAFEFELNMRYKITLSRAVSIRLRAES